MKTDELDDLKQFMTALISQTEIRLEERMESLISELRTEVHDGFVGIADIIDANNKQLDDHEERLAKLEQQAA